MNKLLVSAKRIIRPAGFVLAVTFCWGQAVEEPEFSGVFFALDGTKLVQLERQNVGVQATFGGTMVMKGKAAIKFPGAHSQIRLRSAQSLGFVVKSSSDADPGALYHLRRLEINKGEREVVILTERASPLGASARTNEQSIVSVEYSRYGSSSVKLTATSLPLGEYAIGARGGKTVFCFGVD